MRLQNTILRRNSVDLDLLNGYFPYLVVIYANEQIRIVRSKENNKPRGYAFIVFEHERDMKSMHNEGCNIANLRRI